MRLLAMGPRLIVTAILSMSLSSIGVPVAAQPISEKTACPLPKMWKPSDQDLKEIRAGQRANLCNADLSNAELTGAALRGDDLSGADLTGAHLAAANLQTARLSGAKLSKADLGYADLTAAELSDANLSNADLTKARLERANLQRALLTEAILIGADLEGADLAGAKLTGAILYGAHLIGAHLAEPDLDGAHLANANLAHATYAPKSQPPAPYVAHIQGLREVTFPEGEEIGLVQLRDLLQRDGLRDLEREATFALEHTRTRYLFDHWHTSLLDAAEGGFRYAAFELPTGYGLYPGRALWLIALFWILLIPFYFWQIHSTRRRPATRSGIFRIWSADRIEPVEVGEKEEIKMGRPAEAERLQGEGWTAFGHAVYFSLLSAFYIGWHDFNIGTWITRIQRRDYTLRAIGWVRVVSGLQSLASVYLLAIWALTYFGRPFQ